MHPGQRTVLPSRRSTGLSGDILRMRTRRPERPAWVIVARIEEFFPECSEKGVGTLYLIGVAKAEMASLMIGTNRTQLNVILG